MQKGQGEQKAFRQLYRVRLQENEGAHLTCANTDGINGWAEVLKRFGDPAGGIKPTLFIHSRCARLIECLPVLQHDPHRPEDVLKVDCDEDGEGGDDPADIWFIRVVEMFGSEN